MKARLLLTQTLNEDMSPDGSAIEKSGSPFRRSPVHPNEHLHIHVEQPLPHKANLQ